MARRIWSVPVELPVRYRLGDEPCWQAGVTSLLTESHAFMQSELDLAPAMPVTMIVSLAGADADEEHGGCVVVIGLIRSRLDLTCDSLHTFVVEVSKYRLARLADAMRDPDLLPPSPALAIAAPRSEYRVH